MEYCSVPARPVTTRWNRLGSRAMALVDGVRWILGPALIIDAFRCLFTPDASLLGILVRLPNGAALPAATGLLLGAALLVRSRWAALVLGGFALLAAVNIVEFALLRAQGLRAAAVPFSMVPLALFSAAAARVFHQGAAAGWPWRAAGAAVAGPMLLLLHLFSFGLTDYARPAEAIVVFGARVYGDGTPSLALEDRVRHGARLYREGIAPALVLSGAADETPVMRRLAEAWGVPRDRIEEDPEGLDTWATLAGVRRGRVVAVSHYYHLARIKLTAGRLGLRCWTSPCPMTRRLVREPWFVARECAVFVGYYLFRG